MRIGVFGGSFDPIHNAHLILAATAHEQLDLEQVRFVVAGDQPLKSGRHAASAADRVAMVECAISGIPGWVVDRTEVDRPGPSWMVDTLNILHQQFPSAELVLLLGRDAALSFPQWREPEAIRRLAQVAVCGRAGEGVPPGFDLSWEAPAIALSSTEIRERAAAGRPLVGWVPEAVASYIAGLRLYGSRSG